MTYKLGTTQTPIPSPGFNPKTINESANSEHSRPH